MSKRCRQVQDALLDLAYGEATDIKATRVIEHLRGCTECQRYAKALRMVQRALPVPDDGSTVGVSPNWAGLAITLERGMRLQAAHERLSVALFALTAAGILTAVWVPLLVWNPVVLHHLQAIGFFGIGLFLLPLHVLRERRGDGI